MFDIIFIILYASAFSIYPVYLIYKDCVKIYKVDDMDNIDEKSRLNNIQLRFKKREFNSYNNMNAGMHPLME